MKLLLFLKIALLLAACGKSMFVEEIKQYRFDIEPYTKSNYRIFRNLFQDFNDSVGENVLVLVNRNSSENMSHITLSKNLRNKNNEKRIIGYGGWHSKSGFNKDCLRKPFKVIKKVYAMTLEFDHDFVKNRATSGDQDKKRELQTLFLHEVGHGFKFKHDTNRSAIMYESVDSSKRDHRRFFNKVHNFLKD